MERKRKKVKGVTVSGLGLNEKRSVQGTYVFPKRIGSQNQEARERGKVFRKIKK